MSEENNIENSEIKKSEVERSEIKDSQIKDSEIKESHIEDSKITDSKIVGEDIQKNKKIDKYFKKQEIKKYFNQTINFLKQKKIQTIIAVVLILAIIILGSWIRLQNLPLLKDSTTGEYIPLALDPFYFLRVAETIVDTGGLPEFDTMRMPFEVAWHPEILPKVLVMIYKVANVFGNYSLQYIDVLYPVIFFILGLIVFFLLVYVLTKSKITALLSSAFLAFIPSYLYRTMAGFADHEAIGIFAFFLTLLVFTLSLKYLEKESSGKSKKELIKSIGFGLLVGFATALTIASWGGIAKFVFMIIPLGFFIFWLTKCRDTDEKRLIHLIGFYLIWIISTLLFGMFFGFDMSSLSGMFLSTTGLLSLFVPVFMVVDYLLIKKQERIKYIKKKYREIYSFGITLVLGIVFLIIKGENIFQMMGYIWSNLLHPFGLGRLGLTVAENAQPYLVSWMDQMGKTFFWMFIAGLVFIGIDISKGIKQTKERNLFILFWIIMFSGIIFSRISASHLLNGVNFISQAFYLVGLLLFIGYTAKLYFNNKIKISPELIIIATWMFFMIISARSAIRFFFVLTSFVCFSAGFFVVKTFYYMKKSKDELLKMILIVILILGIIGAAYNLVGFYENTKMQAEYTGPSANVQWQNAMSWTRENTPEQSIFSHWWDYGYWVQTLGERPTIADGGHFQGNFRIHMIGRYLLTTPKPETALSFMKSNNVSYLLIDPTDLGKYAAYSKIGSDENWDRFAYISPFISEKSQIKETSNGTIRIFQGGVGVDEDIVYEEDDSEIFIPGPVYDEIANPSYKAFVGGIFLETGESNGNIYLKQPEAVYIYNEQQIKIPLRYAYINGEIIDFEKGLDAVFFVFPRIYSNQEGISSDDLGAGLYLSPKVSKGLFAQLYLMNDALENYKGLELAYAEPDPAIASLKMQGLDLGEFVYYQGFRGPIKIWEIQENENIIVREEFVRKVGEWAEFDDLELVK